MNSLDISKTPIMNDSMNTYHDIIQRLKQQILDFNFQAEISINFSKEWSSYHEDYRYKIRENLYSELPQTEISLKEFEDLSRIPSHPDFNISISHCRSYGGYAIVARPHRIGFDIECLERVTHKIVNRISNAKDNFDTVVNPAFVWVAKEAAFKAIQNLTSIKVIQEIEIEAWTMISVNSFAFKINNLKDHSRLQFANHQGIMQTYEIDFEHSLGAVILEGDSAFGFYLLHFKNGGVLL